MLPRYVVASHPPILALARTPGTQRHSLIGATVILICIALVGCAGGGGGGSSSSDGSAPLAPVNSLNRSSPSTAAASLNGPVMSIVQQKDGKFVLGGDFTQPGRIVRMNADGSLDSAFNSATGSGFDGPVLTLLIQSDGKIVAGGEFSRFNGVPAGRIARILADGSCDTEFADQVRVGFNARVSSVSLQSGGKLLVGGAFTSFGTSSVSRIARLNSDGSLDPEYGVVAATNSAAPAPEPTYSAPAPEPTAPAPEPTYSAPAPTPTSTYTAPAPEPTYSAPAPEPTYSAPAPTPTSTYTAPAPEPTYSAPAPTPTSTYTAPAPTPTSTYTAPAPTSSPSPSPTSTSGTTGGKKPKGGSGGSGDHGKGVGDGVGGGKNK